MKNMKRSINLPEGVQKRRKTEVNQNSLYMFQNDINLRLLWGRKKGSLKLIRNGSCVKSQKHMEKSEKVRLQPMSKNEWIKANPNKALISKLELDVKENPPSQTHL